MELKYLQTFRTVVEAGSFAKAAEHLSYTQSAITFQMGQLERELGVPLFEKLGRSMTLTQAGALLVPYVDNVLDSLEKLRSFENELSACRGTLRVGVGETLLCYRMGPVLKAFHQAAPQAQLHLRSMNCYDIRNELLEGTLDLGVFYEDVGGFGSTLTTYGMGTYPLALVASPETKQRCPDFITPDQTIPVPFIINEPKCIFRQIFEEYLRARAIQLEHTIELWSIPTIKNLVKSNVGISFLPVFAAAEELASGELTEIPTALTGTTISAVCAHHKNKWLSPLMECFIRLCRETAL